MYLYLMTFNTLLIRILKRAKLSFTEIERFDCRSSLWRWIGDLVDGSICCDNKIQLAGWADLKILRSGWIISVYYQLWNCVIMQVKVDWLLHCWSLKKCMCMNHMCLLPIVKICHYASKSRMTIVENCHNASQGVPKWKPDHCWRPHRE